jgi:putative copper resistance protein D
MARCGIGGLVGVLLCIPRGEWRWWAGLALAGAFAASLAWLGHAGAGQDGRRSIMVAADVAHLLAAGAWPAGLLPFALLLRRRMRAGTAAAAHTAARRFSAMSLAAVGILAASGLINAFFLVGSLRGLVATDYGRLLILKVTLFAAAATLGAWNLLVHKPRLEIAPEALGAIARKVWIEVALGTLIILIVAILGTLPPGSSPGG